ncbi:hypothetical protein ZEAMMB73_Zm00001d016449 [Zea mays]|uniref:Uncharacterized protein n=1 Tax=Zea mays TaxID=4577 RepID=A0A1D6H7Q8_MAIZE|nr:hypothetical protein ZEAMMB73_Zm00001d016449 [Zea mays]
MQFNQQLRTKYVPYGYFSKDTIKVIRPTGVSAYSRVHGYPRIPAVESTRQFYCGTDQKAKALRS